MRKPGNSVLSFILVVVLCIPVYGCVTTTRAVYSASEAAVAEVDGFDNIRAYADAPDSSIRDQTQWLPRTTGRNLNVLCVSGGGSGGAFTVGSCPPGAINIHGQYSMLSQVSAQVR